MKKKTLAGQVGNVLALGCGIVVFIGASLVVVIAALLGSLSDYLSKRRVR